MALADFTVRIHRITERFRLALPSWQGESVARQFRQIWLRKTARTRLAERAGFRERGFAKPNEINDFAIIATATI
jgi:hypothetical protein